MQFAISHEQRMIAETARSFFAERLPSDRLREVIEADGFDRDLWRAYNRDLGLGGLLLPAEIGGAGLGAVEMVLVAEAAGGSLAPIPLLGQLAALAALAGGPGSLTADWSQSISEGEAVVAVAENGLSAHGAVADLLLVLDGEEAWLCDVAAGEVRVTNLCSLEGTHPLARIERSGGTALPRGTAGTVRTTSRLVLAAEALGGASAAMDRTLAYVLERHQFGRAIGSFQAVKHRLADRTVDLEQARSALLWAAAATDERNAEQSFAVLAAKAVCSDTFVACAGDMIQLHGGIAFTWEHDAHLFLRRARAIASQFGTADELREGIAVQLLDAAA